MKIIRFQSTRCVRIGFVMLGAAMTTAAIPGEAGARHWRHAARAHGLHRQIQNAQAALLPQTSSPGSMRYYGGPKSPMWREVK
jgi:hypothetical protein